MIGFQYLSGTNDFNDNNAHQNALQITTSSVHAGLVHDLWADFLPKLPSTAEQHPGHSVAPTVGAIAGSDFETTESQAV